MQRIATERLAAAGGWHATALASAALQIGPSTRTHVTVFLRAGLNVISAVNGTLSTDNFVRDGGSGNCTLP
jgi:hypothetical protein